jgi:uncharacterized membrane protein (DUF373 family)
MDELLELFGFFMLVLIGLELLETIRAYYVEHSVHAEIVIKVAMIAIARKIIILDVKDLPSLTLIGTAAIVIALSAAYHRVQRARRLQTLNSTKAVLRAPLERIVRHSLLLSQLHICVG